MEMAQEGMYSVDQEMKVARRPQEAVRGLGRDYGTRARGAIGVRGRGDRPCATDG